MLLSTPVLRPEIQYAAFRINKDAATFPSAFSWEIAIPENSVALYLSLCFLLLRPVGLRLKAKQLLPLGCGSFHFCLATLQPGLIRKHVYTDDHLLI